MSELPKPGDLIGVRYRIETLLGRGGMGAVFAAKNQATGRAVAIKWMLPESARSKEALARFLAEARSTAKIEHPNVIQILDVGQDGDAPFLVMERLRGESLAERLKKGKLSPGETLEAMIPACKGVHEAHTEGIIHRDLKPDNIFLCVGKDGSKRPPKVLDFGISKLYDDEAPGAQGSPMTRTGIAMGTPWYMSPEQLNAQGKADERYDVYAMGVVLYECLTGRPPYDAEGLFELVQQIAAGNPTPIRLLTPECPPDLEAVVMRAMAADRNHRYASMRELVSDLEAVRSRVVRGAPAPHVPATAPLHVGTPSPAYASPTPHPTPHGAAATTGPMGGGHWTPNQPGSYGAPPSGPMHPPTAPGPAATYASQAAPTSGGTGKGLIIGVVVAVGGLLLIAAVGVIAAVAFYSGGSASGGGGGGGGSVGGGTGPVVGNPTVGGGEPAPNPREPDVSINFSGACDPTFSGRKMVTGSSGTVSVTAIAGTALTGSITLMLGDETGTHSISTQDRIDTQTLINVMVGQQVWTNMTMDVVPVRSGRIPDPISGSITINEWDAELARADVQFHDVTLESTRDGSICRLNGRLVTRGTTYGM